MLGRLTRKLRSAKKRVVQLLCRPAATAAVDEARAVRGRHVFIFGVWGRTSSTALQRLLNSTGQICIWGEPGAFIPDDLLALIDKLDRKNRHPDEQRRKTGLQRAFSSKDHSQNYAMAFPEMAPAIASLRQAFLQLFPTIEGVDRFGFKEIRLRDEQTLHVLRSMFPAAQFVFLFRDPLTQWPSVRAMKWDETPDLEHFLELYERLASIYMEFRGVFIESAALYDRERVRGLVAALGLPDVDERLIGDGVFARSNKTPLDAADTQRIRGSRAYELYLQMKSLSA